MSKRNKIIIAVVVVVLAIIVIYYLYAASIPAAPLTQQQIEEQELSNGITATQLQQLQTGLTGGKAIAADTSVKQFSGTLSL